MVIDPSTLSRRAIYKLLIGTVVPRPIAWVSTVSEAGGNNLAPFSFFTVVSTQPPMMSITLERRLGTGGWKDTLKNIEATGVFVINVVSVPLAEAMEESSCEHPPDVNEFVSAGVTAAPSCVVAAPRVGEALINMECVLETVITPGSDHVVIGRMVRYHVYDDLLHDGRIDIERLQPLGRLAGRYTRITEIFDVRPARRSAPKERRAVTRPG